MRIILQKDVKNLGKVGDQVRVKDGYARNYLLPNKLALVLNEGRLKEWEHRKKLIESRKKQAVSDRKALLEKMSSVELTFERESRSEGTLFGSVTAVHISAALEKQHKFLIDKRDIKMEPLKAVGDYPIEIALDSENKTTIQVKVISKKSEKSDSSSKKGFFAKRFFSKKKDEDDSEESKQEESTTETNAPSSEASEDKKSNEDS